MNKTSGRTLLVTCVLALLLPQILPAQSIDDVTGDMEKRDGFLPLYWDAEEGRLLLEVPRLDEEFLYLTSLATGVGSSDLGLDRGMIGDEQIARFERAGPRVSLVLTTPRFRAATGATPSLERSVRESFSGSTVASFEILGEEDGRVVVDATDFFLRDAMDVTGRLERADQGSFETDPERSSIHLPRTRSFPTNTEVEASITFSSDDPGRRLRQHVPDARSLTLREHHSFVELPDDGYEPRRFDPRIGLFPTRFHDYGKPLEEGYVTRYITRHRLEKRNPDAEMSEPVEPIVYYMDPGIPEPYRSAFREGAEWWSEVLEAAGFVDAFRVEDMPPEMDPMDARYNVIQWVHRTDAAYSIGPSFRDPRTGEIIKAAVRMDSHRSLVDYNLYAGLLPAIAGRDASIGWVAELDPSVTGEEFAMARRRQHAAHEIGHTLGLAHNFVAASYGRASVMDYPAPLILLRDGEIDISRAYRDGPGSYDSLAIRYAYTPLPADREEEELEAMMREANAEGLRFITNPHSAASNSYPEATQWINGSDALDELERVTEVRRFLLDRFDETAIAPGEPMWRLNERLVPVYLHHRFTLEAAIKGVGGMEYRYGVRGDTLPVTRVLPPERQRRALDLALDALRPEELAIPEEVLAMMAPRPPGYDATDATFRSRAAPAFDQLGAARTLTEMVVDGLLHPRRMARVAAFHARDPDLPSSVEVVDRILERTWRADAGSAEETAALRRVVERVVVDGLMRLVRAEEGTPESRAAGEWGLRRIAALIEESAGSGPEDAAHRQLAATEIERFLDRSYEPRTPDEAPEPPAGTPIGSGQR